MLNNAQLIGHLGRDPIVQHLPNGDLVARLSIATSERWRDIATGERREATEWHRVSLFGRLAEVAQQYLKKGALVYVSGKIKHRKYTDSDGIERYTTDIHGNIMQMLGDGLRREREPGEDDDQEAPAARPGARHNSRPAPAGLDDMADDDIPF